MRITKRRMLGVIGSLLLLSLCLILAIVNLNDHVIVSAEETNEDMQFTVTEGNIVNATYSFIPLNETECSVSINNQDEATKAIIPTTAVIDGTEYDVTEIAANGFMASSKLIRVWLPSTIKKIGNSSFSNCPELNRISLGQVVEIGNNAFYKCPKLSELIIPKSTEIVGSNILRNNNTQVKVRAESICEGWSSKWNTNNANQDVELNTEVEEKLELEAVYTTTSRSGAQEIVGYSVANGQPRTSGFYVDPSDEIGDDPTHVERKGKDIFIPEFFEGTKILGINEFAFDDCGFNNLIVEYSQDPIEIASNAFTGAKGVNIIINRSISFNDGAMACEIFSNSTIESVVLPNTIKGLTDSMFAECKELANIYFIQPSSMSQQEELEIIEGQQAQKGVVELPTFNSFNSIGESAFRNTVSIQQLKIYENVKNVGKSIVFGWNSSQSIYIDFLYSEIPEYNSQSKTGWDNSWGANSKAEFIYKEKKLTISLDGNGGSVPYNSFQATFGKALTDLPIPTDKSATFVGWFTEDGTEYTRDTILSEKQDVLLIAKWSFPVYYIHNGQIVNEETQYRGVAFTLRPRVSKMGYYTLLTDNITSNEYKSLASYTAQASVTFTVSFKEKPLSECKYTLSGKDTYTIYGPIQLRSINSIANQNNVTIELGCDIDASKESWTPLNILSATFDGRNHTITYQNESLSGTENFGFFLNIAGRGYIKNTKFKAKIKTAVATTEGQSIGVISAEMSNTGGCIENCEVLKWVNNPSYSNSSSNNVDILCQNPKTNVGGLVGKSWGKIQESKNHASIGAQGRIGGITGQNYGYIGYCENYGNIFYDHNGESGCVGGITGIHVTNYYLQFCKNAARITFAYVSNSSNSPCIAQIAGYIDYQGDSTMLNENKCEGNVAASAGISSDYTSKVKNAEYAATSEDGGGCVAEGTLITLSDGTQKTVEQLTGDEMLLVWNLQTGMFDVAPILFIDSDPADIYEVINLYFSDGTEVKVIYEHAFWDFNLNQYVFLRNDAAQYIGHWFNKQTTDENGQLVWTRVQLTDVVVKDEYTTSWSPVTYSHLCYYVNGMLSMPGATEGLINIFEVNAESMKFDATAMERDIEQYGLFTYEEFMQILPVPQEVFDAFNAQYFKVAIGKGLITEEKLAALVERYAGQLGIE